MCGICGFIGRGDIEILEKMVQTMYHRGPDSYGLWNKEDVYLGMRRLSIIDVETGDQPVFNEDGEIVTVFNGEIYNYVELQNFLLERGHKFSTDHSDTETIVHLYEEFGPEFLHHLNGMFAIAIWDNKRKQLLLARDRVGIKPLYYAETGSGIIFGSEPKALLRHPDISREPDFIAIHHYFSLKNIPAPHSAFKGIKQLHPGEFAIFNNGVFKKQKWWQINFKENNDITEKEAAKNIYELLKDSVKFQIRSDVPFGAYLSGGVDSSAVVCLMNEIGCRNIDTFTLVYDEDIPGKNSDRQCAKEIAETLGTNHHEHLISYNDIPHYINRIIDSFDEPFSGVISTFFLTECIQKHVKVALSGDGADEIFGSYKPHRLALPLHAYENNIKGEMLGDYVNNTEELQRILSLGDEASRRMDQYISNDILNMQLYTDKMKSILGDNRTEHLVRNSFNNFITTDPLNRILQLDFETLLPDQVLAFVDRLSMAHSVEVRPPFLDHRLVEFVATLPGNMKIKNGRVKHILKQALVGVLPDKILNRPKEGFLMPINDWLLNSMEDYVRSFFTPKKLALHSILDPKSVYNVLDEHYAKRKNYGNRIWNLMMFQLWWEKYIENSVL